GCGRTAAEDPVREDSPRHDAPDRRRRGGHRSRDDRRPGDPGRDRRGARSGRLRLGIGPDRRLSSPARPAARCATLRYVPATVIVGAQWGDEGKGKIVDLLAAESDLVCRYQGGPNAGHTIVVGDDVYKIRAIPS